MNKKIIKVSIFLFIAHLFIFPPYTQAIIPPDFIFNISTQIAQFSSVILIFFTAIFGAFFQFFKTKFETIRHKKTISILVILVVIIVSLVLSYFIALHRQKIEYQKWLEENHNLSSTYAL